jgi:hypothetical protein
MTTQKPSIGRIVRLRLSESDAAHAMAQRELDGLRAGNTLEAGQTYPAIIVRVFDGSPAANLQVFLDGNDSHWESHPASMLSGPESKDLANPHLGHSH